jgi:hypothetical protein
MFPSIFSSKWRIFARKGREKEPDERHKQGLRVENPFGIFWVLVEQRLCLSALAPQEKQKKRVLYDLH